MTEINELITDEEVEKIKKGAVNLTPEMFPEPKKIAELTSEKLKKILRNIPPVIPVNLKSGYRVSYSIDEMMGTKWHHIAISRFAFQSKPFDEHFIVKRIIGDNYERLGVFFNQNVIHYRKKLDD